MVPAGWSPQTLTARQVVARPDVELSFNCVGCRAWIGLDPWRIGARLADDPLQTLRFRCRKCGVYPSELKVSRRTSKEPEELLAIPLKPRAWDQGHEEDQRRCLARAEAARRARIEAYRRAHDTA